MAIWQRSPQFLFDSRQPHLRQLQESKIQAFCGGEARAWDRLRPWGLGTKCVHLFYKEVSLSAFST